MIRPLSTVFILIIGWGCSDESQFKRQADLKYSEDRYAAPDDGKNVVVNDHQDSPDIKPVEEQKSPSVQDEFEQSSFAEQQELTEEPPASNDQSGEQTPQTDPVEETVVNNDPPSPVDDSCMATSNNMNNDGTIVSSSGSSSASGSGPGGSGSVACNVLGSKRGPDGCHLTLPPNQGIDPSLVVGKINGQSVNFSAEGVALTPLPSGQYLLTLTSYANGLAVCGITIYID